MYYYSYRKNKCELPVYNVSRFFFFLIKNSDSLLPILIDYFAQIDLINNFSIFAVL